MGVKNKSHATSLHLNIYRRKQGIDRKAAGWYFLSLSGIDTDNMHRDTRQKEAILNILRNTRSHPTADQVYEAVRREIPNISKGTVYRNLKVLQETGAVTELSLGGDLSRFEYTLGNHYHFRCGQCGRVTDVDEPVDVELNRKVAEKTGFQIASHQLEFRGLCRDCCGQ